MIKFYSFLLCLVFNNFVSAESYVKAGDNLIWDSENKSYTANGGVEFQNDSFIAFADKMIAQYIEKNNMEVFNIVELFKNVIIEFQDDRTSLKILNSSQKKTLGPKTEGFVKYLIQLKLESNAKGDSTENVITSVLIVIKTYVDTNVWVK